MVSVLRLGLRLGLGPTTCTGSQIRSWRLPVSVGGFTRVMNGCDRQKRCGWRRGRGTASEIDSGSTGSSDTTTQSQSQTQPLVVFAPCTSSLGAWEATAARYPLVHQTFRQFPQVLLDVKRFQEHYQLKGGSGIGSAAIVVDSLERTVEIFRSVQPRSQEHVACLALLAEILGQCHRWDDCYESCRQLIEMARERASSAPSAVDGQQLVYAFQLSLAKAHWLNGEHEIAMELCASLLASLEEENQPHFPLLEASARTGLAVSRLLLVSNLDHVFSVRDRFRLVVNQLKNCNGGSFLPVALAAAHLNLGIAEAVYAETVSKFNNVDVPLDAAMRAWKQGLTELKKSETAQGSVDGYYYVRDILQARLHANMAWGMLQMTRERNFIPRATEFARQSLAVYDNIQEDHKTIPTFNKEGFGRTLSLLGTCYHKSENAVTAQGLFQSAVDYRPLHNNSLQALERRDALTRYANLCREWEKRQGDANRLQTQADMVDESLPDGWRGKSLIHGSLWFWTSDACTFASG